MDVTEDTELTFVEEHFNFSDRDNESRQLSECKTLHSVKIRSLPDANKGTLYLEGEAITNASSNDPVEVTKAQLEDGSSKLKYTPPSNANGNGFTQFRFRVNDGCDDSFRSYTMTINVVAANDPPSVSGPTEIEYAENGVAAVAIYTATDLEDDAITWSLEQIGDYEDFSIDSATGELRFDITTFPSGPDYDNPEDANRDNDYEVTVVASDGNASDDKGTRSVTVKVIEVIDISVSGPTAIEYLENGTAAVATYTVTNSGNNAEITWSLSGDDSTDFSISEGGSLSFVDSPNYESSADDDNDNDYEVTVKASVAGGTDDTLDVTVSVIDGNDAPVAQDDTATVQLAVTGQRVLVRVLDNDSDEDGDPLSVTDMARTTSYGRIRFLDTDGRTTITYILGDQFTNQTTDTFTYTVSDGTATDTGTVTVNFNSLPTSSNNTVTATEDQDYKLTAADFGFMDADSDTLAHITITSLPGADKGELLLDGTAIAIAIGGTGQKVTVRELDDNKLKYRPPADANGDGLAMFDFKVNDGQDDSDDEYTITIDVTAVQDAPTASNNTVIATEDRYYTLKEADFGFMDADDDTLAHITITSLPVDSGEEVTGELSLEDDQGTPDEITAADLPMEVTKAQLEENALKYTPPHHANGDGLATFDFTVNDGQDDSESAYTITINVTAVNDPPTASDNTVTAIEDEDYTLMVNYFGFMDADSVDIIEQDNTLNATLDHITITSLPGADKGELLLDGTPIAIAIGGAGQKVMASKLDGDALKYRPPPDANGDGLATFEFTVNDGQDDSESAYTITIDVTAVNDPPTASNNTVTAIEDEDYTLMVEYFGFMDADSVDTIEQDNTLNATLDHITITSLPASDGVVKGTLRLNDSVVAVGDTVTKAQLEADALKYRPPPDANGDGLAMFDFTVNDGEDDSESAYTITINVTAVQDAPTASNNTVSATVNMDYTFTAADFGFMDADSDTLAHITIISLPGTDKGELLFDETAIASSDLHLVEEVTEIELDDGKLKYRPPTGTISANFTSFTFKVNDGEDDSESTYTITINVDAVNNVPTASDNTVTATEDMDYPLTATNFGYEDDDDHALAHITITSLPGADKGELLLDGTPIAIAIGGAGQKVMASKLDGDALKYRPPPDANGDGLATFGFTVNDGKDDSESAYTITIDVTAVNDPPTASDNTVTAIEDEDYPLTAADFGFMDADSVDTIEQDNTLNATLDHITITSLPVDSDGVVKGTLRLNDSDVAVGDTVTNLQLEADALKYRPPPDANGDGLAMFDFKVNDGKHDSESAYTITIDVTAVNDAPTAMDDHAQTAENTAVEIAVLTNDEDVDGTILSVTAVQPPNNGSATINNSTINNNLTVITYTPNSDFIGTDTFTYAVSDGVASAIGTVTVEVISGASNANLSRLILSDGTEPVDLEPNFTPSITEYTAEVANNIVSLSLSSTTQNDSATLQVEVNDTAVTSDSSGSFAIDLVEGGETTVNVVVIPQDQDADQKTYTIRVDRAASTNVNLSGLLLLDGTDPVDLDPDFSPSTIEYTAEVANNVASLSLSPTTEHDGTAIQIQVNDTAVTSDSGSFAIDLNVGDNTIDVVLTAQDGSTEKTYTIDVTRSVSSNTDLRELVFEAGTTIEPPFVPAITEYTLYAKEDASSVMVQDIETFTSVMVEVRVDGRLLSGDDRTVELNPDRLTIITITLTDQSTVTIDDKAAVNTYAIEVVPPWPYFTDTLLSPLTLYTDGEKGTRDAGMAIDGDNLRWTFISSDPSVVLVEQDEQNPSVVVVTPGREGKAIITVTAENNDGTQTMMFPVTVITSKAENAAIRAALSGQARVLLGSVTTMIGERIDSGTGGAGNVCISSATGADGDSGDAIATANAWQGDRWNADPGGMGLRDVPHVSHRGGDSMDKTFDDLVELFRGRPYSLHPADWAADCATDAAEGVSRLWTLWGATDLQRARGSTDSSDFDGEWHLFYLGADRSIGERWKGGLSLSQVEGKVHYSFADASSSGDGKLSSSLTALHHYLHGQLSSNLELWLIGGFGVGDVDNVREHVSEHRDQGDLRMGLAALGLRRSMSQFGAMDLSLTSDAGFVSLSTEGDGSLDGAEASIGHLRLGLETSWPFASGAELFAQLHGRHESGDSSIGTAGEMVLGLRYGGERLNLELRGNYLSSGADFEQWGANTRLDYGPAGDGTGLTLSLTSHWGVAENGGSFQRGHTMGLPAPVVASALGESVPTVQLSGEIGYGLAMDWLPGSLTPQLGYDYRGSDTSRTRVGLAYALDLDRDVELRLNLARSERWQEDPDHSIELSTTLRF